MSGLISSNVRRYLEERIADLVLSAHKLPGYRLHPRETYRRLEPLGIADIRHPGDLFQRDVDRLARAARALAGRSSRRLAGTGFFTGLPGGPVGLTAGIAVDLEEYIRRTFLLAQEVAQTFGLIPDPLGEAADDPGEYFEASQEAIFEAMLAGFVAAGPSQTVGEKAMHIAEEHTRLVLTNKARQKAATGLVLKLARSAAAHLLEGRLQQVFSRFVPVVGGGVNAALCYRGMQNIGRNIIGHCEAEHRNIRASVRRRTCI